MVAAKLLFFRPHSLPLSLSPKFIFPRKHSAPYFLILSSFTPHTQSQNPDQTFSYGYGPSLHKGAKSTPIHNHPESLIKTSDLSTDQRYQPHKGKEEENDIFDEEIFTRVFDIAALRALAKDSFALESRLRGHLLNWPRIRNIARVPGDEVEAELVELVRDDEIDSSASLNRRIYGKVEGDGEPLSPILYRDKLARTFNSNGYVNFKNLAKMSRPSKKKKKWKRKEEEKDEGEKRGGKNGFSLIEVVEEEEEEDMKGLLGDESKGGKWRGSTRLLLLDERYGDKGVEDLPEAIKALLKYGTKESGESNFELVRCRLTLFYKYWQMDQILKALLPEGMLVPSAFETVGHIAHLNLRDEHLPYKKLIAKVVLDKHKPKIQTVVNKIDAIHNDYRTMQLEVLAGNHSLVTTLVENGLRFHLDLATVYWNSRLATERQHLLSGFTKRDVVCDVFSGAGPIAISAAKIVKRVYANDLNPYAVEYLERNSVLNKLERRIKVFNMDGRRFIHAMYASEKAPSITQVVMNLPNDAPEYLDAFRGILIDRTGDEQFPLPMIHVYGFSKASDPEFDFHERIRIVLGEAAVDVEMRRVRLVAPRKWMLCASFVLPKSVALAKPIHEF